MSQTVGGSGQVLLQLLFQALHLSQRHFPQKSRDSQRPGDLSHVLSTSKIQLNRTFHCLNHLTTTIKQDKQCDNTFAPNQHPEADHVKTLTLLECTLKPFHILFLPRPPNSSPLKNKKKTLRVGELCI